MSLFDMGPNTAMGEILSAYPSALDMVMACIRESQEVEAKPGQGR